MSAPEPIVIVRTPETQPPAPTRALSPNPLWEIPLSKLSTTRERPIFSPSRRPPPVAVAGPPAPPAPAPAPRLPRVERPQLSLVGTVSGDDESFGIFVDQTTKAALRLKVGEDYRGWKLRAVLGREVTLEYEQQTAILTLPQPGTTAPGQPFLPTVVEGATSQKQAESPPRREHRR
jgi:general secretion pathway protein N